ncbi:MAG: alanine racemase [Candidatus Bathyarchaeia archaeon]
MYSTCAIKFGTPLFVFDEDALSYHYERLRQAFEANYPNIIICYSVKTNFNPAICKVLRKKGAYAEVTSEVELEAVEKAGYNGQNIILDGVYKPEGLLRKALEKKVLLINIESFTEMERLNRIAGEMGVKQSIGLRISVPRQSFFANPNLAYFQHLLVYPECRFGFPPGEAYQAFKKALELKNLQVEGIMMHNSPFYPGTVKTLIQILHKIHKKLGLEIKYLNIGGGFISETLKSISTFNLIVDLIRQKLGLKSMLDKVSRHSKNIELIAKAIIDDVKKEIRDLPKPTIIIEPGGIIVGPAGILLLRVDHVKKGSDGFNWIIVDGGTNLLPDINTVYFRHDISIVSKAANPREKLYNLCGPLCYARDYIAIKTYLPQIDEGDIIAVFDCGAYTLSKSNQFLYPRPAAVLLNSRKEVKLIREKETSEDIFRKDFL